MELYPHDRPISQRSTSGRPENDTQKTPTEQQQRERPWIFFKPEPIEALSPHTYQHLQEAKDLIEIEAPPPHAYQHPLSTGRYPDLDLANQAASG